MRLIMECCPKYYFISQFFLLIETLLMILLIIITQQVFDGMMMLAQDASHIWSVTRWIGLFMLISIGRSALNAIENHRFTVLGQRMEAFISRKIAEKTAKLDPIVFEKTQTLDEINKASGAVDALFVTGNGINGAAVIIVPFFLFMAIYLHQHHPLLIWVIILVITPKSLTLLMKVKLYTRLEDRSAPLRREAKSYEEAMIDRKFFKETRSWGAVDYFKEKYLFAVSLLNLQTWKTDATATGLNLLMTLISAIGYLGVVYVLFLTLRDGEISVGVFAAVLGSLSTQMIWMMDFLAYQLEVILKNAGKVIYLVDFFDLPEKMGNAKMLDWTSDIVFKDVGFTYPDATSPALKGINLSIKANETVALVGENGSGKSTLTKLLLGLYEPTEGQIFVGGVDLSTVDPFVRFKGISAVFQKFQRYELSLKENICLADVDSEVGIGYSAQLAGVKIGEETYPQGEDTVLSREFGGIDLSGGQWQRVAIARGIYRDHQLIVLDEPTSAIDPFEERRLYTQFANMTRDKTAIIVTHRLGSAKIADRIVVMSKAEIVEIGTHESLMENKGVYAMMFNVQQHWYQEEVI